MLQNQVFHFRGQSQITFGSHLDNPKEAGGECFAPLQGGRRINLAAFGHILTLSEAAFRMTFESNQDVTKSGLSLPEPTPDSLR